MTQFDIAFGIFKRFWWAIPLLLAGIYVLFLKGEIRGLNRELQRKDMVIRQLAGDYARCQGNRVTLEASISRQNAAVEAMRVQGEARVAELDRVAVRARQEAQNAEARARRIVGRRSTGDQCADARALILETVG